MIGTYVATIKQELIEPERIVDALDADTDFSKVEPDEEYYKPRRIVGRYDLPTGERVTIKQGNGATLVAINATDTQVLRTKSKLLKLIRGLELT